MRQFIPSGSSIAEGRSMIRKILRQLEETSANNDSVHMGMCYKPRLLIDFIKFMIRLINTIRVINNH